MKTLLGNFLSRKLLLFFLAILPGINIVNAQFFVRFQLPFGRFEIKDQSSSWKENSEFKYAFLGDPVSSLIHMQYQAPFIKNRLFLVPEFGCAIVGSGVTNPSSLIDGGYYKTKSLGLNLGTSLKFQVFSWKNSPYFYSGIELNCFFRENMFLIRSYSNDQAERLGETFMPATIIGTGYSFSNGRICLDVRYTYGFNGLGLNLHLDEIKAEVISIGILFKLGTYSH